MPRWSKITLIAIAVVIGLLLLSMLIVPWQIKKQSEQWITTHTQRTLSYERVYFNPFTLKLELGGVVLTEAEGDDPFIAFERVLVAVSPHSLLRRALMLGRFAIESTQVRFTDATMAADPRVELKNINLELLELHYPVAQTSPYRFAAQIGERGRIQAVGQLVYAPFEVVAQINVGAFPLVDFNDFIPPELNLALNDGYLHTDIKIVVKQHGEGVSGSFSGDLDPSPTLPCVILLAAAI